MDSKDINKAPSNDKKTINIIEKFKKFIEYSETENIEKLILNNEKYFNFLYAYTENLVRLYMKNYNKKIFITKRRNILFLKRLFIKNDIRKYNYKNSSQYIAINDKIFIFSSCLVFIIFLEVLKCKSKNNKSNDENNKQLHLFNVLLNKFIYIVANFYSTQFIEEKHLEIFLKLLIILSIANNNSEPAKKNNNITNTIFLVQCINTIKIIFNKINNSKSDFTEKQKSLMKNIICFLKNSIIGYSEQKPLNIINKFFLVNNDYYTTELIDLCYIIVKMKNEEIMKNYLELLSNIYMFSFGYQNLMSKLLKIFEPLLLNLNKKTIKEIDSEIDIIQFILNFIKDLINRENQIWKDEIILKEGFYLGNKVCGISSEIDMLEDDFILIFGFCLYENNNTTNNINEWTLINIRSKENKDKEKVSQIKIWLSKLDNSKNEYNLIISDKNQMQKTGIIIKSKTSYIFSFNFLKNKSVKISYISDNKSQVKKIKEIKLKFSIDNTYIYIGSDIDKKSLIEEKQVNTFVGYIGNIIILNNKKLSKKGDAHIDLILTLKGDYSKCILKALENKESNEESINLINNEEKFHFRNNVMNKVIFNSLIKIYNNAKLKFAEVIKGVIGPYGFSLVDYMDEIDYLKIYNKNTTDDITKKCFEVRQNYLNLEQKTSTSKTEKTIKILSKNFNSRFNIFDNKYSLEEFVKYDGIIYLGLFLEYDYQIICNIEKEKEKKYILEKIENNMIEIAKFFNDFIINEHYVKNFSSQIDKFFYQLVVVLKKYIKINNINNKIFKLIEELITKITNLTIDKNSDDDNLKNKIFGLKSKSLGLLHDILILFYQNSEFSYYAISNFISIMSKLLIKGKLNDLYSTEFMDEFLALSLIFEQHISFFKNNEQRESLQKSYEEFLIQLLKNSALVNKEKTKNINISNNEEQSKSLNFFKKIKSSEIKSNEESDEIENEYLNHFIVITLQRERFQDIFAKLLNILYKSDLIRDIKPIYISQLYNILKNNYEKKGKNIICDACLKIALIYSFKNKENEEKLYKFLQELKNFNKGFFYSVIAAVKHIEKMSNDSKSLGGSDNINISNSSKNNIENENLISNKENKSEIYPLLNINLNNLDSKQKSTLIKLFQFCISMLFSKDNDKKILNVSENIEKNDAQEIYESLKVNFDAVFKGQEKIIYKDIFDSEKHITSDLFFFKWKKSNKEEKDKLLNDIKYYHDKLLKSHRFPFIFNFIELIDSISEIDEKKNTILYLLNYLIEEFQKYFNAHNKKINKDDKYLIFNIINYVVLINKIILKDANKIIFLEKDEFKMMFYKLINFLQFTGLLYSNYCFEIDENSGKLICEICYDIFLAMLDKDFNQNDKEKFINTFLIYDKKQKMFYSIFYLIDLNKESILKKDKTVRKDIINRYLENNENLKFIHDNFFNSNESKQNTNVYGRKINKIDGVNFIAYFLAKTFIYLKEIKNVELKNLLQKNILPILSKYLYDLWTKYISFYGQKICSRFALYKETKDFFEQHVVQGGNNFEIIKEFFEKDISFKVNGQDKIIYCYASRLLDKKESDVNTDKKKEEAEEQNKNIQTVIPNKSLPLLDENRCFLTFDKLTNENVILNPKNYLLKIVFSGIFKDIFFKDKIFQKVKYSFLCKFRQNKGLDIRTKQLEYPTIEKNFSNSLEPKSFLRRDYQFYNKIYFSVSHEFIKRDLIKDRDNEKLFFYRHFFERDIKNEKEFECELITNRFLYFGKFLIHKDYIYFKTAEDPRDKNPKIKNNIFSKYIFSIKDNENKPLRDKEILLFIKDIKEIIRKRILLMDQAFEIFNFSGKSFFFNFFQKKTCDEICGMLKEMCQCKIEEGYKERIKSIIGSFKKGEISNYEYLLYLNKLSTRTYNDLSQYPIFPWIVKDIAHFINEDNPQDSVQDDEEKTDEKDILRDMNYPISMQNEEKRLNEIQKYKEDIKTNKHSAHCGTHYSTSSYIFYYLMRNNPYCNNLIRLQNYKQENPNRMFLSFKDTQKILKTSSDNRELIPDLFCYIDYLCNVNCAFFGFRNNNILVDDFNISERFDDDKEKCYNFITKFVKYLYMLKKKLNDKETSKGVSQWVDIIFGKKQYPTNEEEKRNSCNIFGKLTYEQFINLDNKLKKYIDKFNKDKSLEEKLVTKIQNRINIIINFGMCPRQILNESIYYEKPSTPNAVVKFEGDSSQDSHFYFGINNEIFYSVIQSSKDLIKKVKIWNNFETKNNNNNLFVCGNFEINMTNYYDDNGYSNLLYKPNYSISLMRLTNLNFSEIFVLTCRYFGNYFKVQNSEKEGYVKIFCEDFVTTIVARNSDKDDKIFYTGLKNGKLIEWKILVLDNKNINNKKKEKSMVFTIKEINHIYDHKSSITAIEINNKKLILATAGEDKFIHIRKLYDFEILVSIDLTYCFANQIVSMNQNIFPSLIKISDLNCIYVLLYDLNSKTTFIRGYTLNGLFFAQTKNEEKLLYNNIIINKNGNIIVGLYNENKILKLNSFDLQIRVEKIISDGKNQENSKDKGTKWIEFDYLNNKYIIIKNTEVKFIPINE